jgi:hypothetical protein
MENRESVVQEIDGYIKSIDSDTAKNEFGLLFKRLLNQKPGLTGKKDAQKLLNNLPDTNDAKELALYLTNPEHQLGMRKQQLVLSCLTKFWGIKNITTNYFDPLSFNVMATLHAGLHKEKIGDDLFVYLHNEHETASKQAQIAMMQSRLTK